MFGVLEGVREAFHGLCITTGMQVLQAMIEGDREDLGALDALARPDSAVADVA